MLRSYDSRASGDLYHAQRRGFGINATNAINKSICVKLLCGNLVSMYKTPFTAAQHVFKVRYHAPVEQSAGVFM
jgi:hypothetical protein